MGVDEITRAKEEIRRLVLPLDLRRTRRTRPDQNGPVTDLRRTIRTSLRQGGEILTIAHSRRVTRPPPLVVLCDISGSMAKYAQILMHFLHAVTNDRDRVSVFLFGTRLSNVTRTLGRTCPLCARLACSRQCACSAKGIGTCSEGPTTQSLRRGGPGWRRSS